MAGVGASLGETPVASGNPSHASSRSSGTSSLTSGRKGVASVAEASVAGGAFVSWRLGGPRSLPSTWRRVPMARLGNVCYWLQAALCHQTHRSNSPRRAVVVPSHPRTASRHCGGHHARTPRWSSAIRRRCQRPRAQLFARPLAPDGWMVGRLPSNIEKTPNSPEQPSGCLPRFRCATVPNDRINCPETPSARNF